MKMNNRFIFGILSIVFALLIAFIAIPIIVGKTSSTEEIIRVRQNVERGHIITAEDVEVVEVGGYNLPENIARLPEDVIGTYAAAMLLPGDYILSGKVSLTPLSSSTSLNDIPDGMLAISITAKTLASGLSDNLQRGDIIRIYHYDPENLFTPVIDIPELRFVKVLCVTDANGIEIDYTIPPSEDEERLQTATITVLASPEQALLLTRYENEGSIHTALITRGNEKLAGELLMRQSSLLGELYAEDLTDTDTSDDLLPEEADSGRTE